MTAPIATSANLTTGLVQRSLVTNTYGVYLTSGGSAYNLTLPFVADKIEWFNYTKYATNSNNIQGVWFRDFPAGDALIIARGTTDLTSTLETTNGITNASTAGGFADEHKTITNITAATPGVVTVASTAAYSDGDRVVITKVIGSLGASVNNQTFVVKVLSGTTFALYDVYGLPVTTSGTYTSGGQSTLTGPSLGIVDSPPSYIYTLGSAVMGADGDVLYIVAYQFNSYYTLGDVGA
jgi:hypothetical protein